MSFDHLDDPAGFVPDDAFRAAAQRDGRRRRTRRRLALAGGSVLTSVAVLIAAVAGYGLWRTSQIDRVDVDFAAPPVALDEPFNVLLIGSDSRAGTDDADVVGGARSDTMIVARVEPKARHVVLLSLPRDLVVEPLEGGTPERLNEAFADGGPARLVATVEERLGIPLSAYVEIDFQGLQRLVDAVDGVPLAVTETIRDQSTGLYLEPEACSILDGSTALALVRSRHLEVRGDTGRWVDDPTSDIGRMARQRAVIAALLPELGRLADGLGGVRTALDVAAAHLTIDDRLDLGTLVALLEWVTESPSPSVGQPVLPVAPLTLDNGALVLTLSDGAAETVAEVGGVLPPGTVVSGGQQALGSDAVAGPEPVVPVGTCP